MEDKPITTLAQLAQFIEELPDARFDMELGFSYNGYLAYQAGECGTPMCIGGWAMGLTDMVGEVSMAFAIMALERANGEFPSHTEARRLCNLDAHREEIERMVVRATPAQAAAAIRILDETGESDWERALEIA